MAAELNIAAFKRVPFGGSSGEGDIVLLGYDWSGAAFAMDIRVNPGDTGTPLVGLTNASAGAEGISATYNAAYPLSDGSTAGATIIRPQINESTMEALALSARPKDPVALHYDLHVTPSGQNKRVLAYGKFTIYPGVTI